MGIEPALVERLLQDTLYAPGRLTLLAYALADLFAQVKAAGRAEIALADYDGTDAPAADVPTGGDRDDGDAKWRGMDRLLAARARDALRACAARLRCDAETLERVTSRVFAALVQVRVDGDPTRIPAAMKDWQPGSRERELINILAGEKAGRLLVTGWRDGTDTVEIAHETLFRVWPELAAWISEHREALVRRDGVLREAARWRQRLVDGGDADALLPAEPLLDDLEQTLAPGGWWDGLRQDPKRPDCAHYLARDHAGELIALTERVWRRQAGDPDAALDLVRTLTKPPRRWQDTMQPLGDWLAGQDPALANWLRGAVMQVLRQLCEPDQRPWHLRRAALGDLLCVLGDTRPGVGLCPDGLPDIDWVDVPAGSVAWGQEDAKGRMLGPGRIASVAAFRMARYPITNAQYQAFAGLERDLYDSGEWWQVGLGPWPAAPSQFPQDNRPKTSVTWAEAIAFCRWLTARLQALPEVDPRRLAPHETLTLPTEDQWLLAAHGPGDTLEALAARRYPWGAAWEPGIANCDEQAVDPRQDVPADAKGLNLAQTTAVGLYPRGAAPGADGGADRGLLDAYGHVWEWCLNKAQAPDDCTPDAQSQRVLRGGGFGSAGGLSRGALRDWGNPLLRYSDFGFRVCVAPPPSTADH